MTAGRRARGSSRNWGTPKLYVDAVRDVLGDIMLDPCSNKHSIVNAAVEYALPLDGLEESWDYETIYVNPPYGMSDGKYKSGISDWLARCADAHDQHNSEVIALVPVATNTSHWKTSVFGRAAAVCFLYDTRLKFLVNGKQGGNGAPMSCAMVYWGRRFKRFSDVFIKYGAVTDIRYLKGQIIGAYHTSRRPERIYTGSPAQRLNGNVVAQSRHGRAVQKHDRAVPRALSGTPKGGRAANPVKTDTQNRVPVRASSRARVTRRGRVGGPRANSAPLQASARRKPARSAKA